MSAPAHLRGMSAHTSRVPAGVAAGGQFATSVHAESEVALHADAERTILRERVSASHDRVTLQWSAGVQPSTAQAAADRLVGVAAAVRMHYPDAASFVLDNTWEPGSPSMELAKVLDANGNALEVPSDFGAVNLGDEEDAVSEMLSDALDHVPHAEGAVNGLEVTGSHKQGYGALVHIDAVLNGALATEEPQPGAVGSKVLESFRALHGDTGADEVGAARDLLTQLHHWARVNGHDLGALVESARHVASEEQQLAGQVL